MNNANAKRQVSDIESYLLKKIILDEPERPREYEFYQLYQFFNFEKHSEDEIKDVVKSLVDKGFLTQREKYSRTFSYKLTREAFINLKQRYKVLILLGSDYNKLIFPFAVGIIGVIATLVPEIKDFFSKSGTPEKNKISIESRIDSLEKKVSKFDTSGFHATVLDSNALVKEVLILKSQYSELSKNVNSLNSLLQENPTKFIEIATLKRDLADIKQEVTSNNESIKRDVDRISSYNNTLIVFMITFLVAYIGIGVFNFISKSRNTQV